MRYLMGQYFLWGLGSCLCLLSFIVMIAIFDGQIDQLRLQIAIFHIYLWPFGMTIGVGLRSYLLVRRGEWLALQCMGWAPSSLMWAAAISGVFLGGGPFLLAMWGWSSVFDLTSETLEWVWIEDNVLRLKDGLQLSFKGERQIVVHHHSIFEPVWLSGLDCLKTKAGQIELQYRFLRCIAGSLGAIASVWLSLRSTYRWTVGTLSLMLMGAAIFPMLNIGLAWGACLGLMLLLYALGSRM